MECAPPTPQTSTTQKLQQWERQVSLEGFYMELQPAEAVHHSQDPVLDQGQQFRDMFYHQRKQYDRRDLLERVFSSWHKKRGLSSAPVLSTSISSVKKAARFLHYSTAPLLFLLSEVRHYVAIVTLSLLTVLTMWPCSHGDVVIIFGSNKSTWQY